nr:Kazal-type serine protease inhibitor domain-containing protein [Nitratireductor kimnyeongensis]
MIIAKLISRFGALAGAAIILASCTVVVEEGPDRPRPPRPDRPQMCTMEYKPVCAKRGGQQRTFGNACSARAQGYRVVQPGTCSAQSNRPGQGRPQACTREFKPVCARKGGERRTFGNSCTARAAGFRVISPGSC